MDKIVKRQAPTADTVRRLFLLSGNQCAFPGCNHPIITGDGTYVGELCHICAAEEGGERFDHKQDNEDRRQFDNLLLLCRDHHVVTNDVVEYPVERMRKMKADHECRFTNGLASMMEAAGLQITNLTISLGGEGGRAPGAGGGGGGAIGTGATGGAGGPGGIFYDLSILNIVELYENWQKSIGSAPGAGGGGAPALGQDAHGGDGGGGGDYIRSLFNWEHLKRIGIDKARVRVGRGGGEACDGQPSGIDLLDDRDNVIISLNAPGGIRGGSPRTSAEKNSGAHQIAVEEQPRVLCSIIANCMEVRDGLLFILGGGWSQFTCAHKPFEAVWPLALQVALWGIPPGGSLDLSVTVLDPDHKENFVSRTSLVRGYTGSLPVSVQILPLKVSISKAGVWKVSVSSSSAELASIPIDVIVTQSNLDRSAKDSEI